MKCLKNILPLLLLFIIGCASVEKVNLPKRGDITFVSEGDGTTTVKSIAAAESYDDAVKEAEVYVIDQIFFRGLASSQQRMPMLSTNEAGEKSKNKPYFDDLFGKNRYKSFVTESKTIGSVKYGQGIQVEMLITVDHRSLRRDLENSGIIRKLGY
jgi:hypothetical protein